MHLSQNAPGYFLIHEIIYKQLISNSRFKSPWKSYLHRRNTDADIKNGFVDMAGEGEGGTNRENSIETYILPDVKQRASGKLLFNRGSSTWYSAIT